MEKKKISKALINRLPRYYRYLSDLLKSGIDRISSDRLSKEMNVTSSQIRQDFNTFGGFGQQGYGYNIEYLRGETAKILGIDREHNVAIIGAGNLCKALSGSKSLSSRGFIIKAIFDNNEEVINKEIQGIKVSSIENIKEICRKEEIDLAIITVPKSSAEDVALRAINAGVKGILNFAHQDLRLGNYAVVENVHIIDSLMALSFRMKEKE